MRVDLDTKKVSVFVTCETMMDGLGMMPTLVDAVVNAGFKAPSAMFESGKSGSRGRFLTVAVLFTFWNPM